MLDRIKDKYDQKVKKKFKKFYNEICFALNDFIPETVRNNNTFFKQNVIKNRYIFLTLWICEIEG